MAPISTHLSSLLASTTSHKPAAHQSVTASAVRLSEDFHSARLPPQISNFDESVRKHSITQPTMQFSIRFQIQDRNKIVE